MDKLEYLLIKHACWLYYPNCPGNKMCSDCDYKKLIEYRLNKYKKRDIESINPKISIIF